MTEFTSKLTNNQSAAFMIGMGLLGSIPAAAFVAICGGWWVVL